MLFRLTFMVFLQIIFLTSVLYAAPAEVPKTGQTTSDESGDDGSLSFTVGADLPTSPRFDVNGAQGIVTDRLTGLIWLRDASCAAIVGNDWEEALGNVNSLTSPSVACSLDDGSVAGDWRLPNVLELWSLAHYQYNNPNISNTAGDGPWTDGFPFFNIATDYWTSTTYAGLPTHARTVDFANGLIVFQLKTDIGKAVWPVRGGATYARLNINMPGSGVGIVSNADFSCSSNCSYPYAIPTGPITLTATPATGSSFEGWGGDCSANGEVTIDGNKTCTATFKSDSMLILMMPAIIGGRENR